MLLSLWVALIALIHCAWGRTYQYAPILTIHGINDECDPAIVDTLIDGLRTYVTCFAVENHKDALVSMFYSIEEQGRMLWDFIYADEELKDGNFSIMAVSQGSVLAKYAINECPFKYPIRTLVSFGGPHMGISGVPGFHRSNIFGRFVGWVMDQMAYWDFFQYYTAPGGYWRAPNKEQDFLDYSTFLAEANNEAYFNQTKKDNWLKLKFARFIKWEEEDTIIPPESAWWGMYDKNYKILNRHQTEFYKKDLLGIRKLEESGRADFMEMGGRHMQFSHDNIHDYADDIFRM